jgi:hypothetical protein
MRRRDGAALIVAGMIGAGMIGAGKAVQTGSTHQRLHSAT